MFGFIDNWVEERLKKILHKRRQPIIEKATAVFSGRHPGADLPALVTEFNSEADRIYAIVDRSILRERVKRAKYTFWITAISSVAIVGLLGGFSGKAVLPFITPPLTALVTWVVTLGTIPVSYNQRIKGAMDSVIVKVESRLQERPSTQLLSEPAASVLENKEQAQTGLEQNSFTITITPDADEELKAAVVRAPQEQTLLQGIQFWKKEQEGKHRAELSLPSELSIKGDQAAAETKVMTVTFHV